MNNRFFAFAAAVCVVALCGPLSAHHGASAYDRARQVSLKATITEFRWTNPHTYILFDAPDGQGRIEQWSCESINPGMLSKQGWTRRTLNAGDKVTIIGDCGHDRRPQGLHQALGQSAQAVQLQA